MPNQFEEFFEEMFSHAMSYKGDPVMKDQVFTHYILGKPHEQRAHAWKNTSTVSYTHLTLPTKA